jgi:glycerophosphoryl diester phosphodiesterase
VFSKVGKLTRIGLLLLCGVLTACSCDDPDRAAVPRIAHAGGGFEKASYTNSMDALQANVADYTLFELDFMFSSDGELVCMHDWKLDSENVLGRPFETLPTLAEFKLLAAANPRFHACTFKDLAAWLARHPDKQIVTDTKEPDTLKVLSWIARRYPDFAARFVVQIYSPDEYDAVAALGYRDIILTVYKFRGDDAAVTRAVSGRRYFAVAMPMERARTLAPAVRKLGVPTYAHTVNANKELETLRRQCVNEIYTDWLPVRLAR